MLNHLKDYKKYLEKIDRNSATEQTIRTPFQNLFEDILHDQKFTDKDISLIQEESQKTANSDGTPDFSVYYNQDTIFQELKGYIECKKLNYDIQDYIHSAQIKKYSKTCKNIILTNYEEFILLQEKDGELITTLNIDINDTKYTNEELLQDDFKELIILFFHYNYPYINNKETLVTEMVARSYSLANEIKNVIDQAEDINKLFKRQFKNLMESYQDTLHYKYSDDDFCDIYGQSLVYGLLLARLDNPKLKFTEFTTDYSSYISDEYSILKEFISAGITTYTPDRIKSKLRDIAISLNHIDIPKIQDSIENIDYTGKNNIAVYLYEEFLKQYDKKQSVERGTRATNGVYYTPKQAVRFITKNVNILLTKHFHKGFLNTDVKILDFATGTGTFLETIIDDITQGNIDDLKKEQVKDYCIKNLYGFELLFTPYIVAHTVLVQKLKDKGISLNNNERLSIFLTNSLDLDNSDYNLLDLEFLKEESKKVNKIKQEETILSIVGNPPYFNGKSENSSIKIKELLQDYKKDLNDKKINLNDLYIQFIRLAEYKITSQGKGVVGIITSNSFLDGFGHRKMRESLLKSFDEIYIVNLHGNSNKKEADKNIFDIKTGVNITFLVKNSKNNKLADIYYTSIVHDHNLIKRKEKLHFLETQTLDNIEWNQLKYSQKESQFLFIDQNIDPKFMEEYNSFKNITDVFKLKNSGMESQNDNICIQNTQDDLLKLQDNFKNYDDDYIMNLYNIKNKRDWNIIKSRQDILEDFNPQPINYRIFDVRYTSLSKKSKSFIAYPRYDVMKHYEKENIGLCFKRQLGTNEFNHIFITKYIFDRTILGSSMGGVSTAPLYLYTDDSVETKKEVNFTDDFCNFYKDTLKQQDKSISYEDVIHYIYAVMHCKHYRTDYLELLKYDYPSIPFTKNIDVFNEYRILGKKLVDLHLFNNTLEDDSISLTKKDQTIDLNNFIITHIEHKNDTIIFNKDQITITGVTSDVYDYKIGTYRPIDKYLKSRKKSKTNNGETLTLKNFNHIKQMIMTIKQTINIQNKITNLNKKYLTDL